MKDTTLDITFRYGNIPDIEQKKLFRRLLKHLQENFSFLIASIKIIELKKNISIQNLNDNKILDNLYEERHIDLRDYENKITVSLHILNKTTFGISIGVDFLKRININNILYLFNSILSIHIPEYAQCEFYATLRTFARKYYILDRGKYSDGLLWLQYFGVKEYMLQGGEAIFENPYIKAERLNDGALIQVGESPYDGFTPEGEELLIKATKAMPPVVKL